MPRHLMQGPVAMTLLVVWIVVIVLAFGWYWLWSRRRRKPDVPSKQSPEPTYTQRLHQRMQDKRPRVDRLDDT